MRSSEDVFLNTMYKAVSKSINRAIGRAMINQAVKLRGVREGFMNALELWRGRRVVLKVEELVGVSGVGDLWEVWDMMRGVIQRLCRAKKRRIGAIVGLVLLLWLLDCY